MNLEIRFCRNNNDYVNFLFLFVEVYCVIEFCLFLNILILYDKFVFRMNFFLSLKFGGFKESIFCLLFDKINMKYVKINCFVEFLCGIMLISIFFVGCYFI